MRARLASMGLRVNKPHLELTLRRVFKSALYDGLEKIGLQQEVAEIGRMHTNLVAPAVSQR